MTAEDGKITVENAVELSGKLDGLITELYGASNHIANLRLTYERDFITNLISIDDNLRRIIRELMVISDIFLVWSRYYIRAEIREKVELPEDEEE